MTDFNDDYDADEMASFADDERSAAREEAARDAHEDPRERHGIGVCATGRCVEPCGMDGGCSR